MNRIYLARTWKSMKIFLLILIAITTNFCSTVNENVVISIDTSDVKHRMKGGMGASWHAISKELPLNNHLYDFPVREYAPRGSAYGGNPPVTDTKAWGQILDHASWLGLNFLRVELSQRMYEPERRQFDWDNEEMQALYIILDWCQENGADVFLQQMWHYTSWNSIPGVHPLISAPENLDDFAYGIATMLEYLTMEKGYTCIKYFCMTNEPPGGTWGYWWEYGEREGSINDAWRKLKEEFDKRDISIPISGPDWTSIPPFDESKLDFAQYLGAIDIHSYDGVTPEREETLREWASWAHAGGKPFFMTEYGNMGLGYGDDHPGQKSFEAAMSNANDVIRALRARVDGVNRWSFTNRGDLDGQWQLIQTFCRDTRTYLHEVKPENEAYYGFGVISRFLSKYSAIINCTHDQPDSVLMSAALVSPNNHLSVFMVNNSDRELSIEMNIISPGRDQLYAYQVSKELVTAPGFRLEPAKVVNNQLCLPPGSITTVSTFYLGNSEAGIIIN
jgi:hypothetical protein